MRKTTQAERADILNVHVRDIQYWEKRNVKNPKVFPPAGYRSDLSKEQLVEVKNNHFSQAYDSTPLQPDEITDFEDKILLFIDALEKLDLRERRVIEMRFGLCGGRPLTLEEVSQEIGRTRERVRMIQNEALVKLKSILNEDELED